MRSFCRPVVTVVLAGGLASMIFAVQVRRPVLYEAEVGLLVTEGAFEADGRPRPQGELRSFLDRALFADHRLGELIRKHDLIRRLRVSDLLEAQGRLRKLIKVETWFDYFSSYRQRNDPPRSARVTIGFSAHDSELALEVARALGELVAETQTARDVQDATAQVNGLRLMAINTASESARLRDLFRQAETAAAARPDLTSQVRASQLKRELAAAENSSRKAASKLLEAQLQLSTIQQIGGRVQIVDPGIPMWRIPSKRERLMRQAALSFGLAFPLMVILIGAFDPIIRDEQDLYRTRIRLLGFVPACRKRLSQSRV